MTSTTTTFTLIFLFLSLLCLVNKSHGWTLKWKQYPTVTRRLSLPSSTLLSWNVKNDFPIFQSRPELVYLDSAATSQLPNHVLQTMDSFYRTSHSNVHRSVHRLGNSATRAYERARDIVAKFIHADSSDEVVFTHGATESLNLLAHSLSRLSKQQLMNPTAATTKATTRETRGRDVAATRQKEEVLVTMMEHHSVLVPWQWTQHNNNNNNNNILKYIPITSDGEFDKVAYLSLLNEDTKVVVVSMVSNVLGCINPIAEITQLAHAVGAVVVVDASQALGHMVVDVQALDVDFLVGSCHKMCGPTGVGLLYGKKELLSLLSPLMGGGEMIDEVQLFSSTYAPPPLRFEAGTPPIAAAIGFGAACEYLTEVGVDRIERHSESLGQYMQQQLLANIPGITVYGPPLPSVNSINKSSKRVALTSFNIAGVHPTDLALFLDQHHVAVRSGHHCTQPLHRFLHIPASLRSSAYLYNNEDDIDAFVKAIQSSIAVLLPTHHHQNKV